MSVFCRYASQILDSPESSEEIVQDVFVTVLLSEGTPQLETKELQQRINAALQKLPEECRKVFRLSHYEELSYREIADFLEISAKTAENQMGKALNIMRREIASSFCFSIFSNHFIYH